MNIIPNPIVVGLQLIPFLITIIALYQIIWKPMLAYLDERNQATEGARAQAEALQQKIAAQLAEYDARLAEAQATIREQRASKRAEAMKAYTAHVEAARREADKQIAAALAELETEQVAARAELKASATSLADQISGRILQSIAG